MRLDIYKISDILSIMKLTHKIAEKQSKAIHKLIVADQQALLKKIKKKYPKLIKAMQKNWNLSDTDLVDEGIYAYVADDLYRR